MAIIITKIVLHFNFNCNFNETFKNWLLVYERFNKFSHREISQSLDVVHSSEYCLAMAIGARQTLDPLAADTSHTSPGSQSASSRHSSPSLRPYTKRQFPVTEMNKKNSVLNNVFISRGSASGVRTWI